MTATTAQDIRPRTEQPIPRWRTVLEVATLIVLIAAALAILWKTYSSPGSSTAATVETAPPADLQPLAGAPGLGDPGAPVALIIYSDFQCPYCGRFARDVFPQIKNEYVTPGLVKVVFRHLPLPQHQFAVAAAETAACADRHGLFWPLHDALFAAEAQPGPDWTTAAAGAVGLDAVALDACRAQVGPLVMADLAAARKLRLTGTPRFFIGTVEPGGVRVASVVFGAKPFSEFQTAIDGLLPRSRRPR